MLLNLSNHPSGQWSEAQLQKAIEQFGQVVDMPFPVINPEGDEMYIKDLAHTYLQRILAMCERYPDITVHIMGELNFCFALVELLKKSGIACVASTTTRKVIIANNSKKVSEFEFVRFRYY